MTEYKEKVFYTAFTGNSIKVTEQLQSLEMAIYLYDKNTKQQELIETGIVYGNLWAFDDALYYAKSDSVSHKCVIYKRTLPALDNCTEVCSLNDERLALIDPYPSNCEFRLFTVENRLFVHFYNTIYEVINNEAVVYKENVESICFYEDKAMISDMDGNILSYDILSNSADELINADHISTSLPGLCAANGVSIRIGNILYGNNCIYGISHGIGYRAGKIIKINMDSGDINTIADDINYSTLLLYVSDDDIYFSDKENIYKCTDNHSELLFQNAYCYNVINDYIYCFTLENNKTQIYYKPIDDELSSWQKI